MRRWLSTWSIGFLVGVVGLLVVGLRPGTALAEPLDVTLGCPATISPGGTLTLSLTMRNTTTLTQTVAKSGLAAHLGDLEVLGPFVIALSRSLAPGATVTVSPYLVVPFPSASRGTFSSLAVMVLDSANQVLGSHGCLIEVR